VKMEQITRRTRRLATLTTAFMVLVPLASLFGLAVDGVDMDALRTAYGITLMPDVLSVGPTLVWAGVEAGRMLLFLWVLWCVRGWFLACAGGAIFAGQTARHVQRIGTALVVMAVAHVLGNTVIVAALTWDNPAGQRSLAVGFGSTECLLLLAAGLMTVFGWIQSEAARLNAENEEFV